MKRKHEKILKEVLRVSEISRKLLTLYSAAEIYFMICFLPQYDFGRLDNKFKKGPVVTISPKGLSNYPLSDPLQKCRFFYLIVTRLRRENQYGFLSEDTRILYRYWINEKRLRICSLSYDIEIRL